MRRVVVVLCAFVGMGGCVSIPAEDVGMVGEHDAEVVRDSLATVQEGMSLDEFRVIARDWPRIGNTSFYPPHHFFTVDWGGHTATAMQCYFFGGVTRYCIFIDGKLAKVVKPPAPAKGESEIVDSRAVERLEPVTPEAYARRVLEQDPLSFANLAGATAAEVAERRGLHGSEPNPFLAPFMLSIWKQNKRNYQRSLELMDRFDGLKVELGATPAEVSAALGEPLEVIWGDDSSTHVYGPRGNRFPFPNVTVKFREGRVNGVFNW
jgi:hypothetical protein